MKYTGRLTRKGLKNMSILKIKEANCKSCYRCIRECPVKAIGFKKDQAEIIEDDCILCGRCIEECPQKAKVVRSDSERVYNLIQRGERVFVSLAPSYVSVIEDPFNYFQNLGFTGYEETAVGAGYVTREYERIADLGTKDNIITSSCPVVMKLITKYYPETLKYAAEVLSPMQAHARILKGKYGPDIKVVFIGPCIAKKEESDLDFEGPDFVLTFEEINEWYNIKYKGSLRQREHKTADAPRLYPEPGGILKSLKSRSDKYTYMSIDGLKKCSDTLEALSSAKVKGLFIEMSACEGSCLGGSGMPQNKKSILESIICLSESVKVKNTMVRYHENINLHKEHISRKVHFAYQGEEQIRDILSKIGKTKKEDELNCGGCGYNTCREKAHAVLNGKADLKMCLPYIRERVESITNEILRFTPNAILTIDTDFIIQDINPAAEELFDIKKESIKGTNAAELMDEMDFHTLLKEPGGLLNRKGYYAKTLKHFEKTLIHVKQHDLILCIMKDITRQEKHQELMIQVKNETLATAQKVIEKQMKVAQEIASLLGETTAETKVALTKLKKTLLLQ
jgi:iron only hydrogenase large subunit-like protein